MTYVVCVWVNGNVKYPYTYVERLAGMVRRWMDRPYTFTCLTDRPHLVSGHVQAISIPNPKPLAGWWAKVSLFNPELPLTGRVLYLDLDTLIVGPLAPILDYPSSFSLIPHAGTFNGRNGLKVVKRFNSSVMVWDAGVNTRLFTDWTRDVGLRLHGDQDWIGEQMPEANMMPLPWFPRLSELDGSAPHKYAKVVLAKKPKNEIAAQLFPWVEEVWR